jgi:tetratricopeptide (TPR) repeat protein/predicted Ser/Thr protein kinase
MRRARTSPSFGSRSLGEPIGSQGDPTVSADAAEGEAAHGSTLPRGYALGRYIILSELGSGGMGVVYMALDPELDRRVAVKLLRNEEASEGARVRLLREAQALARLSHPNVVTIHDVGEHEGQIYIAMEYVEGSTLTQWCKAPRTWKQVLDTLVRAGEGLAAAHEGRLVHRDFKPDNVMVGRDGRVRVMDFGLARGQVADAGEVESTLPGGRAKEDAPPDPGVTRGTGVVGTPAYMSPEQLLGRPVDARSDQFSFCVALWEALYGARPFPGRNAADLTLQVVAGPPRPPRGPAPAWLGRALVRGLAPDPEQRHRDMDALLAALADRPAQRRRRRVLGLVVGLVLAGGGAAGYALANRHEAGVCEAHDPLVGVWDPDVRAAVAARFAELELSFGAAAFADVAARLDDYAARLRERFRDTCESRLGGLRSGRALELQVECSERLRGQLAAVVDVLRHADPRAVEYAGQAVAQLPAIEPCGEVAGLLAVDERASELEDPARLARVRAQAPRLAAAKAELDAGHHERSREIGRELVAEAERLEHLPLLAEALYMLGQAEFASGDYPAAGASLTRSFQVAEAARQDPIAARSAISLVFLHGRYNHDIARAMTWTEVAEAKLARTGDDPVQRMNLLINSARALLDANQLPASEQRLREALTLAERRRAQDPGSYIHALNALASLELVARRPEAAEPLLRRSLALSEQLRGPAHPSLGVTLHNLGYALLLASDPARAVTMFERALEVRERSLGSDHPATLETLNGLGTALRDKGDRAAGREIYRRVVALEQSRRGPDHLDLFAPLNNLGWALLDAEDWSAAATHFERARALLERHGKTDGEQYRLISHNLGVLALERGEPTAAVARFEAALALATQIYGPESIDVGAALAELAAAELAVGNTTSAETRAARALELIPDVPTNALERMIATITLATIRARDPQTRVEALALAREAATVLGQKFDANVTVAQPRRLRSQARRLVTELSAAPR